MDNPDTYNSPGLWAGGAALAGGVAAFVGTAHIIDHLSILSVLRAAESLNPLMFGVLPAIAGAAGAVAAGALGWHSVHQPAETHVRGPKLARLDHRPAAKALKPRRKSLGLSIHPQIKISEEQECRHMLLLGGSGSGKTSILWPVINQAQARGDKCLIFSFKGDFQQKAAFDFSLLAPWDSRSVRWQLGKDIRTRLHAESLAKTLCPDPESGEKIWAQGAQGLLTAIISGVQNEFAQNWGFCHLARACSIALSDYDALVQTVMRESPLAKAFLMGKDSKTTASYLAQMASGLSDVINLGVADSNSAGKPWSVTGWLAGDTPGAAILGYLPESEGLSQAFCSSMIEQVVKKVLGFADADPAERRIWLFLDEVPQAGKIPSITSALEAARSKGCRVVLGMQGVAQLEEHGYSKNTLRIWAGQCGIKIIANLTDPQDQKWASDLLGERDILRYQRTLSQQSQGGTSGSVSGVNQSVKEHLMLAGEFGNELIVTKYGPKALLLTPGANAILQWGFPKLQAFRAARIDADWTLAGFNRPVWGAVPPRTGAATQGTESSASVVAQKTKTQQTVVVEQQDTQTQAPPVADAGLADLAADHVVSASLDAALPGAGALFELMSMSEPGAGGPAPATHQQQTPETEDEDEHE